MPEKDVFVNQAFIEVTESAINTLTFSKLETGVSIHEKVGWIIERVDYNMGIAMSNFAAELDGVIFGLATSDALTSVTLGQSAVLDYNTLTRHDMGTAGVGVLFRQPLSKTFSNLSGGGILVPPNPLFIYAKGATLGTVMNVQARLFYTVRQLKLEDFWELVELRRMIGT